MSFLSRKPRELPTTDTALPGRDAAMLVVARHLVGAERCFGFVSPEEAGEKRPGQILCRGVSSFGSWLIDRADSRGVRRASRKVSVAQVA